MSRQLFILVCFMCFMCVVSVGVFYALTHAKILQNTVLNTRPFVSTTTEITHSKKAKNERVLFVGDIMLGRNVENLMRQYGYWYPFSQFALVEKPTFIVGNFEASIPKTHSPTQSMQFSFSTHPDFLQGLSEFGFTHVGLSNNHSYDFGFDDFLHTQKSLTMLGLAHFGDQQHQASSTIAYLSLDTKTVSIVGVYAVDIFPSKIELQELVEKAKKQSDIQIAFVHFGTEYVSTHSQFQEQLAHTLVDAGIDVVIGHHPHVIQDIELYNGVPIFYSLGNFIFDQYFSQEVQEGLAVEISFEHQNTHFKLIPVTSVGSRSAPRVAGQFEKNQILETLAAKSTQNLSTAIVKGEFTITQ